MTSSARLAHLRLARSIFVCALTSCVWAPTAAIASAQTPPAIDDPPAPEAPAVVSRDDRGRATVRAIKLSSPLVVDGRLDEADYADVTSVSDFVQQVPREGALATERTEAWVLYDGDTLYVSARCWDTAPPEQWVANELRRHTNQLRQRIFVSAPNFSTVLPTTSSAATCGSAGNTSPAAKCSSSTLMNETRFARAFLSCGTARSSGKSIGCSASEARCGPGRRQAACRTQSKKAGTQGVSPC